PCAAGSLGRPALAAVLLKVGERALVFREHLSKLPVTLQQDGCVLGPSRLNDLAGHLERLGSDGHRLLRRVDRGDTRPWSLTATAGEDQGPGHERTERGDDRTLGNLLLFRHFLPPCMLRRSLVSGPVAGAGVEPAPMATRQPVSPWPPATLRRPCRQS